MKNVEQAGGKVTQAKGDGAYDSNPNFEKLEERHTKPCIKIRAQKPTAASRNPRKKYAREFHELGYKRWRDKYGYGRRWYVEVPHSVVKRKCGEYVQATKKNNIYHEVKLKYLFYNTLIRYDVCGVLPWQQDHAARLDVTEEHRACGTREEKIKNPLIAQQNIPASYLSLVIQISPIR